MINVTHCAVEDRLSPATGLVLYLEHKSLPIKLYYGVSMPLITDPSTIKLHRNSFDGRPFREDADRASFW